jgi:hypothetical protein
MPCGGCRGDEESAESRYARAYEARVNPFTEFQNNELDSRVRYLCAVVVYIRLSGSSEFVCMRVPPNEQAPALQWVYCFPDQLLLRMLNIVVMTVI